MTENEFYSFAYYAVQFALENIDNLTARKQIINTLLIPHKDSIMKHKYFMVSRSSRIAYGDETDTSDSTVSFTDNGETFFMNLSSLTEDSLNDIENMEWSCGKITLTTKNTVSNFSLKDTNTIIPFMISYNPDINYKNMYAQYGHLRGLSTEEIEEYIEIISNPDDYDVQTADVLLDSGSLIKASSGSYLAGTNSSVWDGYCTYHYGAQFPKQIMENVTYKDVTDDVAALLNRIEALRDAGDYLSASTLINTNRDILKPYVIDSRVVNRLFEEQRNTEIYAKREGQNVFFNEEPYAKNPNDVLIIERSSSSASKPGIYVHGMPEMYNVTYRKLNSYSYLVDWSNSYSSAEFGASGIDFGDNAASGYYVCYKVGGIPKHKNDGTSVYLSGVANSSITVTGINRTADTYFRIFPCGSSGWISSSFKGIIKVPTSQW